MYSGPEPNFNFYRLLPQKRVEDFLNGKIKVGTLDEFRGHFDREARRQKQFEAIHQVRPTMVDTAFRRHMTKVGSPLPKSSFGGINDTWEGVDCYISSYDEGLSSYRNNRIFQQLPNMMIFCGSSELTQSVVERMRRDSKRYGGTPYSSAIPILKMREFFSVLGLAAKKHFGIDQVASVTLAKVIYGQNTRSIGKPIDLPPPSPFSKRSYFASQKEVRYIIDWRLPDFQQGAVLDLGKSVSDYCGEPVDLKAVFGS
ncbi:MAG: hypothetical protein ABJN21_16805 [Paracoccaceae bacterium]